MDAHGSYAAIANIRARDMPSRMAFALFIATAAWIFTGGWGAAAWFAAVVVGQLIELPLTAGIRRRPDVDPPRSTRLLYCMGVGCNAAIYSSIAAFTFFEGGVSGQLFGLLIPAGALLNVAMAMERAPRAMVATWAPHVVYFIGLPVTYGVTSSEVDLLTGVFVSGGGIIFFVHVVMALRRIHQGSASLRAARDLAETERARAERASAAKSIFVATMSHEIRTPMNAVVAAGDLLRRTPLTAQQAEHVQMLTHSSELLMGVLNDVLDLSKIESGKLAVERQEVALLDRLDMAVRLWRPKAADKGVTLEFDCGGLPERIMADPLRLQQIVFNLLSNAVKFTDQGSIRIAGGRSEGPEGERLWIEVADSGSGMTPEMCTRVFASFEQGSSGVTRTHGGTGLGLTISRRLAELMGGDLTVSSEQGVGSVFRLQLPLVQAAPVLHSRAPDGDAEEGSAVDGLEVLLAEDHEVNQRIVKLVLEPLGCRITVAQNGHEAAMIAQRRPFDVILMDMQMPLMGGIEATSCIRLSGGPNAATPILALSANVLDEHRAQWAAVGVQVLLTKPIDMPLLIASLQEAARPGREATRAA